MQYWTLERFEKHGPCGTCLMIDPADGENVLTIKPDTWIKRGYRLIARKKTDGEFMAYYTT